MNKVKQFFQKLFLVAMRDLRDNFWMWAAVIAVAFGSFPIAFGFVVFAFYDKLDAILNQLKKTSAAEINIGSINLPEIKPVLKVVKTGEGEEHF